MIGDWVKTCTAANIPLSKTDHPAVNKFLKTHVKNGGAIPGGSQLHTVYLPELYKQEFSEVTELLVGQPVSVIFDEMPDDNGRCVLNILVTPLSRKTTTRERMVTYLLDSFLWINVTILL